MKTFEASFNSRIQQEVLTLCHCWLITRRDGRQFGFTDFDAPFIIDSVEYVPTQGFNKFAEQNTSDVSAQNSQIQSILASDAITAADLLGGDYDNATLRIFIIDWTQPPSSLTATPLEYCPRMLANFGEISSDGRGFSAQLVGRLDKFNASAAQLTSQECRYQLGDSRCTVNTAGYTTNGSITAIESRIRFTLSSAFAFVEDYFSEGVLTFTSGQNAGDSYQIRKFFGTRVVELYEPVRRPFAIGETVRAIAGCDKSLTSCEFKFDNVENFGGEPHIPGWDATTVGKGSRGANTNFIPPAPTPPAENPQPPQW